MIKPIAILKDSLREAWDSKTLLVMLILAGLFLIGVASIGYTAATPQAVVEGFVDELSAPVMRINRGKAQVDLIDRNTGQIFPHAELKTTSFKTLKEGSHESTGEHEFTVVVKVPEVDKEAFDRSVAAWHEDGTGKFVKVEGERNLDPTKLKLTTAKVTDDMVREYFAVEFERRTQAPIASFERLPDPSPLERLYRFRTGPSIEPRVWPVKLSLGFGAYEEDSPAPLGILLYVIQDLVISSMGGMFIILIAVVITSFFIPNMLQPGSVVMLLSKPINRMTLLLFKYFGGLFFVLILGTFVVGGVWLITGLRAGVWAPGIFLVVPLLTFSFAILYSVSTLTAVLTRNSIVAILVTLAVAFVLWGIGKGEVAARNSRLRSDAYATLKNEEPKYQSWAKVIGALNTTLPRWKDIDLLAGHAVMDSLMTVKQQELQGSSAAKKQLPTWGGTIGVSLIWIAGFLGLACWRFARKDY